MISSPCYLLTALLIVVTSATIACPRSVTTSMCINWTDITYTSKTTNTIQVVANPLLNLRTSGAAKQAWESLRNLKASYVRYCPWFPYPSVGVAELLPPNANNHTTFWNFGNMMSQLGPFMDAQEGRKMLLTLSTNPAWMYDGGYSYPLNPNNVDWGYESGAMRPNTTDQVARYYGRVMNYLLNGEMKDEFGRVIKGGPAYGQNITYFEVLNEPEGEYGRDPDTYTSLFDAVVAQIRRQADPQHKLKFVGLALEGHCEWEYYETFLNPLNHEPEVRDVLDTAIVTFHFYAGPSTRFDAQKFSREMFVPADDFVIEVANITRIRDRLSPNTMLDCNELGVILPNDNDQDVTAPPMLYWNAAGAMYAYLTGRLTEVGLDIIGHSQLAGTPPIPKWDIHDAQFPSVSLLDWNTGNGTARYWVTKLLIEEFGPGDHIVRSMTPPQKRLCGSSWDIGTPSGYDKFLTLQCAAGATIESVSFASYGTPHGECNTGFEIDPTCHDPTTYDVVTRNCVGQNGCTIALSQFQLNCGDNVEQRLVAVASCGEAGGWATPDGDRFVYSQARITRNGKKKIFLVNKHFDVSLFTLPQEAVGGTVRVLDTDCGFGPARTETVTQQTLQLQAYAVAIVVLP